ncbi:hypothetical protein [Wolbachia pipientis]|nr:hypothetical protein [Wolbachia pipientis]
MQKINKICTRIEQKIKPQINNKHIKLRKIRESAVINGTFKSVEIDNKTFYIEFSQEKCCTDNTRYTSFRVQ